MTEHRFEPSAYHNSFGSHEPVLTIAPGDRVLTTTADAFGRGQSGDHVATPGNPLTGPFFVQGAEPGDQLVIHLETILPNRDHGFTIGSLAPPRRRRRLRP